MYKFEYRHKYNIVVKQLENYTLFLCFYMYANLNANLSNIILKNIKSDTISSYEKKLLYNIFIRRGVKTLKDLSIV